MSAPHFDAAVVALTGALGDKLEPGITDFIDLFTEDAVIDVPFDGDGTASPIQGRASLTQMAHSLEGILRFETVMVSAVHTTGRNDTVICEYEALLHRSDLGGSFTRRYIGVITVCAGRIKHLREYGGPFQPAPTTT